MVTYGGQENSFTVAYNTTVRSKATKNNIGWYDFLYTQ